MKPGLSRTTAISHSRIGLVSSWPPTVVHRRWWQIVGGYSIEFSPGMSSDNDLAMKLWHVGCRHFIGLADSRVYHFQCKSTGRIVRNNGNKTFMKKWGMTQSFFNRYYLRRGEKWAGRLENPVIDRRNFADYVRKTFSLVSRITHCLPLSS